MSSLFSEYKSMKMKGAYYQELYKKILSIYSGTGGQNIITGEILQKGQRVKDFIVLNPEITQSLNFVLDEISTISKSDQISSKSLFYFSQYGGSKTQFIHLVENEVNNEVPHAVCVIFEDLNAINVKNIAEKLIPQILQRAPRLSEFENDQTKYKEFFKKLNNLITDIQISFHQSKNLKRAEELIRDLETIKNPEKKKTIEDLNTLLHSSILVDDIDILDNLVNLMKYCSEAGMIFIFQFDEVDLWLDVENNQLSFSSLFNAKTNLMKKILEITQGKVKIITIFACTERVNQLLREQQPLFSTISPSASRLIALYNNSNKIQEPGSYGDSIDKALITLASIYSVSEGRELNDPSFLDKASKLLNSNYKQLSRRVCNSKILELIRNQFILYDAINSGLKEWETNAKKYGDLIQEHLPMLLKRLNVKFIRKDISIDPEDRSTTRKIDGYIEHSTIKDQIVKIYVEIKLCKAFVKEKAIQALQWIQLHPNDPFTLIVFSPTPSDQIKKEINRAGEDQGFSLDIINKVNIIHIEDPYAFVGIKGVDVLSSDANKLNEFYNALAFWIDSFGRFSSQYTSVKRDLNLDSFISPEPKINPQDSPKQKEKNEQSEELKLDADSQDCLNILVHLYKEKAFTESGKVSKAKIQNIIQERNLGITDYEQKYEIMKKSNIISNITEKQVRFMDGIRDITDIQEFLKKMKEKLLKRTIKGSEIEQFLK